MPNTPINSNCNSQILQIASSSTTKNFRKSLWENFFLDLCAGSNKPLSHSLIMGSTRAIDVLLANEHDLLVDEVFEIVLRVASSGQAACTVLW